MRLIGLKIKNFRGYRGEFHFPLESLTALVGRNDAGKSTVLDALGVFFESPLAKFDSSDRCVFTDDTEVRIGCIFDQLPNEIVIDSTASTTLQKEYLVNADGFLEIHRVFKCDSSRPKDSIVAIAHHPMAEDIGDILSLKNGDLKKLADSVGVSKEVDRRSNVQLREAILKQHPDIKLGAREVPLNKEDAKAIWDQIVRKLPAFVLFRSDRSSTDEDSEVQDPMRVAIQLALKSVESELEHIKETVKTRTLEVACRTVEKLRELDENLASELNPSFKTEPKWDGFKLSLTDENQVSLNKRGSGVRRLVVLSFFRAEAERLRLESGSGNIIYAIEEPETAQHPSNQKRIIEALKELAEQDGIQVILTTHVPGLVEQIPKSSIRHIIQQSRTERVVRVGGDATLAEVAENLGVLPDGKVKVIVCVEGPNDVRCLRHLFRLVRELDPALPDLDRDTRIAMIPLGGGNLKDWVNEKYLRNLGIPEIHIYDRDSSTPPRYQAAHDAVNSRGDGSIAFITKKRELENYLHPDPILEVKGIQIVIDDFTDVPMVCAKAIHEQAPDSKPWDNLSAEARKEKEGKVKKILNSEIAEKMSLDRLRDRNAEQEILKWFKAINGRLEGSFSRSIVHEAEEEPAV